jgi:hypothetical protein
MSTTSNAARSGWCMANRYQTELIAVDMNNHDGRTERRNTALH